MSVVDVLMVEDNRGDVVLVQEAMARANVTHRLHVVRDGVEALEFLRRRGQHADAVRPGLIVLDLKLPRMSGIEVLEDIESCPELLRIPIVILSSSRSELDLAKRRSMPWHRHMLKPSTFAGYVELVAAINGFLADVQRPEGGAHE